MGQRPASISVESLTLSVGLFSVQGSLIYGGTPLCKWWVKSDVSLSASPVPSWKKILQRPEATHFKAVVDIIWMDTSLYVVLAGGKKANNHLQKGFGGEVELTRAG